jgi:hypothetical protein
MDWTESHQLRHAAQYSRLRFLRDGRRGDILEIERELRNLGYDGMVTGLSADDIIRQWKKNGWIEVSPNGSELRLSEAGIEQLAKWEEEDALWQRGVTEEITVAKRLKAGEPATNLRKLAQVIGGETLIAAHDPYLDEKALETLQKLKGLRVNVARNLRLLTAPKAPKAAGSLDSFLSDLNTELKTEWELRSYSGGAKPHRRFLILKNGTVVTCGLSLNNLNKDEVLDHLSAGQDVAAYDREFFETAWKSAARLKDSKN